MQRLKRWREVGNRKQSGSTGTRLVLTSRLAFTNATARMGFRLSPTCSPIRYGLGCPSGYLFIGILNDKGRYRQHPSDSSTDSDTFNPTRIYGPSEGALDSDASNRAIWRSTICRLMTYGGFACP